MCKKTRISDRPKIHSRVLDTNPSDRYMPGMEGIISVNNPISSFYRREIKAPTVATDPDKAHTGSANVTGEQLMARSRHVVGVTQRSKRRGELLGGSVSYPSNDANLVHGQFSVVL
jgi:hypothetical protein